MSRPGPLVTVGLGIAALAACTPEIPESFLVMHRDGVEMSVSPQPIPSLDDPTRMTGDLGQVFRGGLLSVEGYREGGEVFLEYHVEDGIGVPHDEDGLILWSFYAHLGAVRADLDARGYDVAPLFPMGAIAYLPASVMDISAVENAAYSPAGHVFVLFPDLVDTGAPLAANDGVVRHEFGHAWFEHLTSGSPGLPSAYEGESVAVQNGLRALNEGFADMVATLTLDQPDFFSASFPMASRDVRGEAAATAAMFPSGASSPLSGYDPYALGTVFASFAWDIRVTTDDPDRALASVVAAVVRFASEAEANPAVWADLYRFAALLVAEYEGDPALPAICEAYALRFPEAPEAPSCAL